MTYFIFNRELDSTIKWLEHKFAKKPILVDANVKALKAGYHFAETIEVDISTFKIEPAKIEAGTYRTIAGNVGTALGFILGAEKSGLNLFLGSYPITPASDILHELAKYKSFGVKTFQAEDEIAGICSAIGAAFGGALSLTTTSGPGLALKGEAIGLAVMFEIPLVIVDVQRGGPSTGLPTKTEQSDLNIAMFGRNGECPAIVIAASRPNDCFNMAYEACRLSLEHMTPVILLTDGYIANGAEPWKVPDLEKDFPKIKTKLVNPADYQEKTFLAYARDKNLVRNWAIPGMPGLEHRIGGLEKAEGTGNVSYDGDNHQRMCDIRQQKIDLVANDIPLQNVEGKETGDLLVISWGGTYGATHTAVKEAQKAGHSVSLAHIKYLSPFPRNLGQVIKNFKKILVPELNAGQLRRILDHQYDVRCEGYNKLQGLPFKVSELVAKINSLLG
jgi:2-oxoglutarate ferredoxin oxidoreductase subunit alpha